jgi:general secretion pathway protein C
MPLDTLIKQLFPVILGGILAVIAYFQASGVVQLVASKLLATDEQELAQNALKPKRAVSRQVNTRKTAQPIIDNNIFDWEVDLDPPPPPPPEDAGVGPAPDKPALDLSNPLGAERCPDITVRIITESPDPTWSIAVLQGPGETSPSLRRVGDMVGSYQVAYIGYNRVEASPAAWLIKDAKLCQAFLFVPTEPPKAAAAPAASTAAPPPVADDTATRRGGASLPPEIADKITKISETEYTVERSVVDHVLENQAELMKSARIVPEKGPDGNTVGIRLFGVRPDTLLGALGLKNGDRLEGINGFNLGSPEEALNAYARLRSAPKLNLTVTRRGQPTSIDININSGK